MTGAADHAGPGPPLLTVAPSPFPVAAVGDAPGAGDAAAAFGESWVGLLVDPEFHPPLDRRPDALAAMAGADGRR